MSSLARAKHPKTILGAVDAGIDIPLFGITISFVSVSANTQQNPVVQQNASAQQEVPRAVANVSTPVASPTITNSPAEVDYPKPAQSPLSDPLAPEPSTSTLPAPEAVTAPAPVASVAPSVEETPSAVPTPTPRVKASTSKDAQDVQGVQAPRAVKKETDVARSWNSPSIESWNGLVARYLLPDTAQAEFQSGQGSNTTISTSIRTEPSEVMMRTLG